MSKKVNARKSRKINVNAPVNAPVLQLAFHAATLDDAPVNDSEISANAILVIENVNNESDNDIFETYKVALAQSFKARIDDVRTTDNLRDELVKDARATFDRDFIARELYNARVVPDVMTHCTSGTRQFDQKTYRRALDVLNYATGARFDLNNQAQAIFESLYRFENAELLFTYEHARNCCNSDRVNSPAEERYMSHTKAYGKSTQNRQSGMSINAFVMLNAVFARKSGKHTSYTVNPDSHIAQALIEKLNLAA